MRAAHAIDFVAEARAFAERRLIASKFANVTDTLDVLRECPVRQVRPTGIDKRPEALNRGPCPRCQTRGDLGCDHQRPCLAGVAPSRQPRQSSPERRPRPFTAADDERLVAMRRRGASYAAMASALERPTASVHSRLATLWRHGNLDPELRPIAPGRNVAAPKAADAVAWQAEREWCQQCEQLVDRARARACGDTFCARRDDAT